MHREQKINEFAQPDTYTQLINQYDGMREIFCICKPQFGVQTQKYSGLISGFLKKISGYSLEIRNTHLKPKYSTHQNKKSYPDIFYTS